MRAIPAIDLIDNTVVRLYQGDYKQQTSYSTDPLLYAKEIAAAGITDLHLVDLSGAKIGALVHTHLLAKIANETGLSIDFGGGVKTEADIETILNAGAKQVVVGSLCAKEPEKVHSWISKFGVDSFVLALDTDGEFIKISGWQESSGKTLEVVMDYFKEFEGLRVLTTDIRRDGTGKGPSALLYKDLCSKYPNQRWIASGGVEQLTDLYELRQIGCYACVIGKALLDGKISVTELKIFNDECL